MKDLIRIVWTRRTSPKAATTTDEDGFILMEFGFNTGERKTVMVLRAHDGSSSWQKVLFTTPSYLTDIEVWYGKDETYYIFATPSKQVKELLP